ncbi:GGDEF domain-containing protein [Pseudorhodoferax sp.]|uniref:GGDEF domain-containing protein n=1 Tax=Pseudorhodoferax sp. TaxID=1993553 RepID=UPI002DD65BF9|nr:diguanylate cyclase [Pseudorhodoferax sp.]
MNSQRDKLDELTRPHTLGPPAVAGLPASPGQLLAGGVLIALIMTAVCLFGVWTRLAGQLAVFWPANALLLGLFLRFPRLDTAFGWIGAVVGHLLAGYLAGDALPISVLLTLTNFACVVSGYLLLAQPFGADARRLHDVAGVLQLVAIVFVASAAGGLAGSVVGPIAFGGSAVESGLAWFVSELVNYIAILPAVLSIPTQQHREVVRQWRKSMPPLRRAAPLVALLLSMAAAVAVGGPGAVAFPVPALLWCGMRYGVFSTAMLTLLTTTWTLVAISKGVLNTSVQIETPHMLMSVRLGVTLIALSPIAVASAMAANRSLMARLLHMAEHDPLTGTMNRRAFATHAGQALEAARGARQGVGLLVLDIDRFKNVNDTYGHSVGDQVIVLVADVVGGQLPDGGPPLLGRLGGEEFAVLLTGVDSEQARQMAERMRQACAQTAVDLGQGRTTGFTVSIGACVEQPAHATLDRLLQAADRALYEAKRTGRNRVVLTDTD